MPPILANSVSSIPVAVSIVVALAMSWRRYARYTIAAPNDATTNARRLHATTCFFVRIACIPSHLRARGAKGSGRRDAGSYNPRHDSATPLRRGGSRDLRLRVRAGHTDRKGSRPRRAEEDSGARTVARHPGHHLAPDGAQRRARSGRRPRE